MPEYLTPGVYIEEIEIGAKPIEGVSTSTAAFLGETERGPTYPKLVTSFVEYRRIFGGLLPSTKPAPFLPQAVDGFFANGGKRCYVCRVVKLAVPAANGQPAVEAATSASAAENSVNLVAAGEGLWGTKVGYTIKKASSERDGFRLQLHYWTTPPPEATAVDPLPTPKQLDDDAFRTKFRAQPAPQISEDFDDLVMTESSPNFVGKRLDRGLSNLVVARVSGATKPAETAALKFLKNGVDGSGDVTVVDFKGRENPVPASGATPEIRRTGLEALKEPSFEEVALLYAPNAFAVANLADTLMSHCENNKFRFAILDSLRGQPDQSSLDPRSGQPPTARSSNYAAFYYPWIRITDPITAAPVLVPPGGHMAGIYARTDIERGVFKAPANEIVRGAFELEFEVTDALQGILNPRGVNVIRAFPGRGRRIWGARTVSDDALWKYISVRRLFIFLEASIFRGTQWVVFEPNNERLWARVKQTITEFLRTQFRAGALLGATEEEAFFVKVDRSTMTDDDINNGRLIVLIGVAPVRPAEFVIFRIAQLTSSATSVEL